MQKEYIARNASANAVTDLVDTGSFLSAGYLNIYNSDATKITGLSFSNPAFRDATDGTCVSYPINDATALIDGTASFFRIYNRDSTHLWSGNVTRLTGTGDLRINSLSIPKDTTISITEAYYISPV